jgi:hypothetical protein
VAGALVATLGFFTAGARLGLGATAGAGSTCVSSTGASGSCTAGIAGGNGHSLVAGSRTSASDFFDENNFFNSDNIDILLVVYLSLVYQTVYFVNNLSV